MLGSIEVGCSHVMLLVTVQAKNTDSPDKKKIIKPPPLQTNLTFHHLKKILPVYLKGTTIFLALLEQPYYLKAD